jgi:organic radical activating enzyme
MTSSSRWPAYRPRYVCVTGGEPLAQPNAIPLLQRLCDAGYESPWKPVARWISRRWTRASVEWSI